MKASQSKLRVPVHPALLALALLTLVIGGIYIYRQEQLHSSDEPTEHAGPGPVQQVGR